MAILVLADYTTEAGQRVREAIIPAVAGHSLVNYQSAMELAAQLSKPGNLGALAVILAGSQAELDELINIRHLLENVRTVLILPDGRPESVAKGHTLCPRYLSYADADLSSVGAVLRHMLERESLLPKPH